MVTRAYKYRIYPSEEQEVLLNKTFGCVRVVWNASVSNFNSYASIGPNRPAETSTQLRRRHEWMSEVSAAALQQKEIDFRNCKKQYFSKTRKKKVGRPDFKHKDSRQSFRLPNQKFTLGNHRIRLEKIGWIDAVIDRRPSRSCKFISVTVSKNKDGKFYASVLVEEEVKKSKPTNKSVGLDLGLTDFAVMSDGKKVPSPNYFRKSQAKLGKAQKRMSRKIPGSSRHLKCKLKVAKIHAKIANQRKWFHHDTANAILKTYDFVGIEDLNVSGMVKNRKLAKSISDAGWAKFVSIIEYKAKWLGKQVVKVDRFFPSTKTCSKCDFVKPKIELSERTFTCDACGYTNDRDVNASINTEKEALRISARGVARA